MDVANGDSVEKEVFCAVSVDGDLRVGDLEQQRVAVRAMRRVYAELDILGTTSWLINEHDFNWTRNHEELLLELAESHECIGLHDHLDSHYLENESHVKIFEFLSSSRSRLDDFYHRAGLEIPIVVHRNGGAQQGREIYRALELMNYAIVSDVWPGMKWYTRTIPSEHPVQHWTSLENPEDPRSILTDNSQVPLIAVPWRHDPENWLDTDSRSGCFLQLPITCLPWVDQARIRTAVKNSGRQVFLVIDTHPYNLQDPSNGRVVPALVDEYCASIRWIRETYHAAFIRMDHIPDLITFEPNYSR